LVTGGIQDVRAQQRLDSKKESTVKQNLHFNYDRSIKRIFVIPLIRVFSF
jgi:hypothetical protein